MMLSAKRLVAGVGGVCRDAVAGHSAQQRFSPSVPERLKARALFRDSSEQVQKIARRPRQPTQPRDDNLTLDTRDRTNDRVW